MKSINATIKTNGYLASMLDVRRCHPLLDTAGIKRAERRGQRRHLRAELASTVHQNIMEGHIPTRVEVATVQSEFRELPLHVLKQFSVPAGYGLVHTAYVEVQVTRKRPLHRTRVETLKVAV